MLMPATGCLIGTPASIRLKVAPHTLAMLDEPFDSMMSETMRIVYGNSSAEGMTGARLFSARAPWPMSRRRGPRIILASPTENGGKL